MNYHFTKKKYLEGILTNGLIPRVGKNSKAVNDTRDGALPKLCYSIGEESEILMNVNFFIRYAKDPYSIIDFDDYLRENDILLSFAPNLFENENGDDIVDAHTTKEDGVKPEHLKIVRLENKDGTYIYDKNEVLKWMMSQIPMESFRANPKYSYLRNSKPLQYLYNEYYPQTLPVGISDEEKETLITLSQRDYFSFIEEYYTQSLSEIEKYKGEDYTIDFQDFMEYCNEQGITKSAEQLNLSSFSKVKELAKQTVAEQGNALEFSKALGLIEQTKEEGGQQK